MPRAEGGRGRILVLGYVVRCPLGGMAWHYAQYFAGLAELGYEVWFIEDSEDHEWSCYDPESHAQGIDPSYGLRFAAAVFERLGLGDRWAYHDAHTATWHGPLGEDAVEICRSAEMFLNVSGANPVRPWLEAVPHRVFVDTDPAFEQVRQLSVERRAARAAQHNSFFSFGENIGRPGCLVPDDGLPWQPTRQPIVLSCWPVTKAPPDAPFTTVMQWDSYESRRWQGVEYGMKSRSFQELLDLPAGLPVELQLAMGSPGAPRDELRRRGWHLRDPLSTTRDPWTYQRFIQESRGELSVAKHGYVISRSGWFSERSAAYLASGRPVVAQDTGFGDWLPAGEGVWPFTTVDEARAAILAVCSDYEAQCAAARRTASRCFDSAVVLEDLIGRARRSG